MPLRGKFLTLEGVDGAGKSSHIELIADLVRTKAPHVVATREPGGTDLAEQLRDMILAEPLPPKLETLFIFAARGDHVARVIAPALAAGTWVICDRFIDATLAYQGAGKGVPLEFIEELRSAAHPDLMPDRTLVFDCPYAVSQQRLRKLDRALDHFEREDQAFFERVRTAYLERARAEPGRVRIIDASADLPAVRKQIETALADF